MLAALAWRNLWRRPQRTILSLISIALVTALLVFMLSFQEGVYGTMKQATLGLFDGYAELQPPGWADDPTLDKVIDAPGVVAEGAARIPAVAVAAPRVNAFAILAQGDLSFGAAVIGVDPSRERRVSTIAGAVRAGRYLVDGDNDAAILGDTLAHNLALKVGDRVTLVGSARDGSVAADVLRVVGLFHSGVAELDRAILEMPLARAQNTFGMDGAVNTIALGGPSLTAFDRDMPSIRTLGRAHGLAVLGWAELEPALREGIALKYAVAMVFYATLVVVVAFIILNTLLMSVLERTREFGMLLALGMRSGQIGAMVWMELLGLAAAGCALGLIVGGGGTLWLEHTGVVYDIDARLLAQFGLPRRLYPALTPTSALFGPIALLVTIIVGGLIPALRVARLTPALAMRAA